MDAKTAAEKASKNRPTSDGWGEFAALVVQEYDNSEDPAGMIYDFVWDSIENHIEWRAGRGRSNGWLEPFAALPHHTHCFAVENDVMDRVVSTLGNKGYGHIKWDRRDERVVLQFKWDS